MRKTVLFFLLLSTKISAQLPETGISGVYEVMVGTKTPQMMIKYFGEYGFTVKDSAKLSENQALEVYGVKSALTSYRLQNGEIDSHGLLRLLVWEKPLGDGIGFHIPESVGSRMAVMMTKDIIRLVDVYKLERQNGKQWLPIEPIFDDPLHVKDGQKVDFFNRPVGVRETAIYGDWFTHVFFQRYGYEIPGYGTINPKANLQTSEFTHHDFFIKGNMETVTKYYAEALGLKPEKPVEIDGDWLKGPKQVFQMPDGYSHYYRGYVSPNNICGKLKFFVTRGVKPDLTEHQRIGEMGITLHSLYTPKLAMVHDLIKKQGITQTKITKNEFNELCFTFLGTDGVNWQIIEKTQTQHKPVSTVAFKFLSN